jgi:ferredoxin-thioredoxin reductase catalytic subunit
MDPVWIAAKAHVNEWLSTPQQKGRPPCPCGFVGGTRNIIKHRTTCPAWAFYARMRREELPPPTAS